MRSPGWSTQFTRPESAIFRDVISDGKAKRDREYETFLRHKIAPFLLLFLLLE